METVSVNLPKELADFALELYQRIQKQDDRGTAKPYFLVIIQPREIVVPAEYDYDRKVLYISELEGEFEDENKALVAATSYFGGDEYKARKCVNNGNWCHVKNIEYEENVFLTDEGYKDHLRLNRHNLKQPYSYLKHAFRNPEMEGVFKLINAVGEQLNEK